MEFQTEQLFILEEIKDPHPYLSIWVDLKRWGQHGSRPLPMAGGYLDQDAELMWAIEICDNIWARCLKEREATEIAQQKLAKVQNPGTAPGGQTFALDGQFA